MRIYRSYFQFDIEWADRSFFLRKRTYGVSKTNSTFNTEIIVPCNYQARPKKNVNQNSKNTKNGTPTKMYAATSMHPKALYNGTGQTWVGVANCKRQKCLLHLVFDRLDLGFSLDFARTIAKRTSTFLKGSLDCIGVGHTRTPKSLSCNSVGRGLWRFCAKCLCTFFGNASGAVPVVWKHVIADTAA